MKHYRNHLFLVACLGMSVGLHGMERHPSWTEKQLLRECTQDGGPANIAEDENIQMYKTIHTIHRLLWTLIDEEYKPGTRTQEHEQEPSPSDDLTPNSGCGTTDQGFIVERANDLPIALYTPWGRVVLTGKHSRGSTNQRIDTLFCHLLKGKTTSYRDNQYVKVSNRRGRSTFYRIQELDGTPLPEPTQFTLPHFDIQQKEAQTPDEETKEWWDNVALRIKFEEIRLKMVAYGRKHGHLPPEEAHATTS